MKKRYNINQVIIFLEDELNKYKSHKILNLLHMNHSAKKCSIQFEKVNKKINELYNKRILLDSQCEKIYSNLIKLGLTEETLDNFPHMYTTCGVEQHLEKISLQIEFKEKEYKNALDNLSDENVQLLDREYDNVKFISKYILSTDSSKIQFYILYLLNNLDTIINEYIEENSVDAYKLSELSRVIIDYFNTLINDIKSDEINNKKIVRI